MVKVDPYSVCYFEVFVLFFDPLLYSDLPYRLIHLLYLLRFQGFFGLCFLGLHLDPSLDPSLDLFDLFDLFDPFDPFDPFDHPVLVPLVVSRFLKVLLQEHNYI